MQAIYDFHQENMCNARKTFYSSGSLSLSHNPLQRSLLTSQPLSYFGVTLAPCWFTCFVCDSFILLCFSHASLLSEFFFSSIPPLSPTLISCCQRNSNTFRVAHPPRSDVTCKKFFGGDFCFRSKIGQYGNCKKEKKKRRSHRSISTK